MIIEVDDMAIAREVHIDSIFLISPAPVTSMTIFNWVFFVEVKLSITRVKLHDPPRALTSVCESVVLENI